jgi:hypothetical protein
MVAVGGAAMPADWIKMRTDLYRDPKVIAMANALRHGDVTRDALRDVTSNVTSHCREEKRREEKEEEGAFRADTSPDQKPQAEPKPKHKAPGVAFEVPSALNDPLFLAVWCDWVDERKKRGKSLTARAAKLQLASLLPLGPEKAAACIRLSIEKTWTGLFPERFAVGGGGSRSATKAEAQDDYLARMMADCIPAQPTNQQPQLPGA